jgi:hypothetical protein
VGCIPLLKIKVKLAKGSRNDNVNNPNKQIGTLPGARAGEMSDTYKNSMTIFNFPSTK